MMGYTPTYSVYKSILWDIIDSGRLCDYSDVKDGSEFVIIRHDVEFSIKKAYIMAKLEHAMCVQSSYFIQIGNEAYNPFSENNAKMLREMAEMGHKLGLHYRQSDSCSPEYEILRQCKMLEDYLDVKIDRFSTHRPNKNTPYHLYAVDGIINAYSSRFFERTDDPSSVKIRYVSDSNYRWNYGLPEKGFFGLNNMVQLLIHPFQWADGYKTLRECFSGLQMELERDAVNNFKREYKNYEG